MMSFHYIIHQEAFCAKKVAKFDNVFRDVTEMVNHIMVGFVLLIVNSFKHCLRMFRQSTISVYICTIMFRG